MSSLSPTRPPIAGLIDAATPAARALKIAALVLVGVALLTLAAKAKVPFHPVPMTLQTLAVLLIGAACGARLGAATVVAYIAAGVFLGLPVFTNTPPVVPGPAYLAGPTAGFLLGFVAAAALVGFAVERGARSALALGAAATLGIALVLTLGTVWLGLFAIVGNGVGIGLERAFAVGAAPFLLGEAVKIALFVALCVAARRLATRA
jgi:biotin transport system substrate-specific component